MFKSLIITALFSTTLAQAAPLSNFTYSKLNLSLMKLSTIQWSMGDKPDPRALHTYCNTLGFVAGLIDAGQAFEIIERDNESNIPFNELEAKANECGTVTTKPVDMEKFAKRIEEIKGKIKKVVDAEKEE